MRNLLLIVSCLCFQTHATPTASASHPAKIAFLSPSHWEILEEVEMGEWRDIQFASVVASPVSPVIETAYEMGTPSIA